jgi:hypothetical protein
MFQRASSLQRWSCSRWRRDGRSALLSGYLAELREMIDAVRAANDPALGATAHVERIAEHLVRGLGTFIKGARTP